MGTIKFKKCGCCFYTPEDVNLEVEYYNNLAHPKINIDFHNITHECQETWNNICRGNTIGVFQLEKSEGKHWSKLVKPRNIVEMGHLNALLRPGCPQFMKNIYCDVKQKTKEPTYLHDSLKPILSETNSVLLLQEQSIRISMELAGFTSQDGDLLRITIGKKLPEKMAELKNRFIDGCIKHSGLSKEEAEEIFSWIEKGQKYQFNLAHAICYSVLGYWCAYIKTHFPAQFYCAWLYAANDKQDKSEEINTLVNDAKLNDIDILPPSIKYCSKTPTIHGFKVIMGLINIKGLGNKTIEKILLLVSKHGNNMSWLSFLVNIGSNLPKNSVESLIYSGFLDCCGTTRQKMLFELFIWHNLTKKEQAWIINEFNQHSNQYGQLYALLNFCARPKKEGGGCANVNRINKVLELAKMCRKPPYELHDTIDSIVWGEENYIGIPLTYHNTDIENSSVLANSTCKEAILLPKKYMIIYAKIQRISIITAKKGKSAGKQMAFINLEDKTGILDCVAFPEVYDTYKDDFYDGNMIYARISKSKQSSFIIDKVFKQQHDN